LVEKKKKNDKEKEKESRGGKREKKKIKWERCARSNSAEVWCKKKSLNLLY
jgi:hypothetical protein